MAGSWRKYTFFEKDVVSESLVEYLGCNVVSVVAEGGMLLFGDENGRITMTGRDFHSQSKSDDRRESKSVFRGPIYGLTYLFDPKNHTRQYIIAIGDDNAVSSPRSKASTSGEEKFDMSSHGNQSNINPATIKVFNASDLSRPIQSFSAGFPGLPVSAKVTSYAVLSDGSEIVVGFSSGAIVLFVGSFFKDSIPSNRSSVSPIVLLQEHAHSVTALYYCEIGPIKSSTDNQIRLFAVFDNDQGVSSHDPMNAIAASNSDIGGISVYDVSTSTSSSGNTTLSSTRKAVHILDDRGASRFCACYVKDTKELVVGRNEGIFSYSVEDRGAAAGFEGEKQCVSAVGRYILVASLDDKSRRSNITIYDLRNKFISFSGQIAAGERVASVTHDGGMAYILTSSQMLLRYRERDTASKVEVLLKKSLFPLAISLATEEQSDISEIMKLYKQYGDHLYKKGDYDAAMVQFISTIGYLQSSYVIRRYLEPHRMFSLTTYLEKILERGLTNKEHKTLLLTCYTKLQDEDKIKAFLSLHHILPHHISSSTSKIVISSSTSSSDHQDDDSIDAKACVDVLTEAGYIDYALLFTASYDLHHLYLHLQLTKAVDVQAGIDAALVYISSLSLIIDADTFLRLLMEHLPTILSSRPDATTGFLIHLCRGDVAAIRAILSSASLSIQSHVAAIKPSTSSTMIASIAVEDLLSAYVDHDHHLKLLIEGVYASDMSSSSSMNRVMNFHNRILPTRVTNTLLELYLIDYEHHQKLSSSSSSSEMLKQVETKIMSLLDGHEHEYDHDRALFLTHSYNHHHAYQFLLERSMSTPLLVRMCIEKHDDAGLMKILRRYGSKNPELYVQILSYLVKRSCDDTHIKEDDDDVERWDVIKDVMSMIEKESILTPAQVIDILSLNSALPLHIASTYIMKMISEVQDDNVLLQHQLDVQHNSIISILTENSARKQLLPSSSSSSSASSKIMKASQPVRDSRMHPALRHHHHDHHDDEEDDDDHDHDLIKRELSTEQKKWESILKAQVDRAHDHESFYAELEHSNSADSFSTIASYLGKTIIYDPKLMPLK